MKNKLGKCTADNINPAFLRVSLIIIVVISVMAGPLTARAKRRLDDGGRPEQSALISQSIAIGGQEKESKQEEKAGPVTAPKVTFNGPQPYPEQALNERITSTVKLRLLIRADGSWELDKVLLEEPEDYGFAESAIKYLGQSTWTPATRDGKPFDAHFTLTIVFQPPPKPPAANIPQDIESHAEETVPVELTEDITKPTVTFPSHQPFPTEAKLKRRSGMVKLRLIIRKDGSFEVEKILAEAPRDSGFAEAALEYVAGSNWKPAMLDGRPVDVFYEISIQFTLGTGRLGTGRFRVPLKEIVRIVQEPEKIQALIGYESEPEVRFTGPLPYPQKAKDESVTGVVKMRVLVRKDGSYKVDKILEEEPEEYGFGEAALLHLNKSEWTPAMRHGTPTNIYTEVTIPFELEEPKGTESVKEDQSPEKNYLAGSGGNVPKPELIRSNIPKYPRKAMDAFRSGYVFLEAVIDERGNVVDILVLKTNAPDIGFVENAIQAVKRWKFKPSHYEGKPVKVRIRFAIEFKLVY